MPMAAIKNLAKKSGKSEAEVESLYKDAKKVVRKEYPDTAEDSDKFYALVWGVLKRMTGTDESEENRGITLITEAKVTGKSVATFIKSFNDEPTELPEALTDKFKLGYNVLARVVNVYVNRIKRGKYKSDKEFIEALDLVLTGKKGPNGE